MNKLTLNIITVLLLILLGIVIIPMAAIAAETPVQKNTTIEEGSCTYTQEPDYVVFQLAKLEFFGLDPVNATVTVNRVSGDLTNQVGTLVVTTGAGTISNLSEYVFRNDKLVTIGAGTNAGTQRATGTLSP